MNFEEAYTIVLIVAILAGSAGIIYLLYDELKWRDKLNRRG